VTVLAVVLYVAIWTLLVEKGYQSSAPVSGTTSIKVKGSGSIGNESGPLLDLLPLDAMDLVAIEENAFFVVTSRVTTPNQTRGVCEGNEDVQECSEADATPCTTQHIDAGTDAMYSWKSQGIFTGNCAANGRCEVYSWCPLEDDSTPDIVNGVGAFTTFVKVDINFQTFGVSRNNYGPENGPEPTFGYNLFRVDEMLSSATNGRIGAADVARKGAIILVTSIWDCDLDYPLKECKPRYRFQRMDGDEGSISTGFNIRTITYDTDGRTRYLEKRMGIRFVFIIQGIAGRFNFAALTVTAGAGLAYLGLAAIVADLILVRFLPQSAEYTKQKIKEYDEKDDHASEGSTHTMSILKPPHRSKTL